MKIRTVLASSLREYPVCLVPGRVNSPYACTHVVLAPDGKTLVVFAGLGEWKPKERVEVVDHGPLDNTDVIRLQIILSYGWEVPKTAYQKHTLRYISARKIKTWHELARDLCCTRKWLWDLMKVPEEIGQDTSTCPANAYNLAKLKEWKPLIAQARTMDQVEFFPVAMAKLKEEKDRTRRRRKT